MRLSTVALLAAVLQTSAFASVVNSRQAPKVTQWSPPGDISKALDDIFALTQPGSEFIPNVVQNSAYGFDAIIAAEGKLRYCVTWDSEEPLSPEYRDLILRTVTSSQKSWMQDMVGFMGWPYSDLPVEINGWATRDPKKILASEQLKVYINTDADGHLECDPRCARARRPAGTSEECTGGPTALYDLTLRLTKGFTDEEALKVDNTWGQSLDSEYFELIQDDKPFLLMHQFGRTLGLASFGQDTTAPAPPASAPDLFLMKARDGRLTTFEIKEIDTWMMRDVWRHVQKTRYPDLNP